MSPKTFFFLFSQYKNCLFLKIHDAINKFIAYTYAIKLRHQKKSSFIIIHDLVYLEGVVF
jgi:hypothetical protein